MPQSKRLLAVFACLVFVTGSLAAQGPKADAKKDDGVVKMATQGATPAVGEITLDHTFKQFINADGRMSMKELRGSVILFDWWGIH